MNESLADFLWDTVAPKKKVPRSIPDYLEMVDEKNEADPLNALLEEQYEFERSQETDRQAQEDKFGSSGQYY